MFIGEGIHLHFGLFCLHWQSNIFVFFFEINLPILSVMVSKTHYLMGLGPTGLEPTWPELCGPIPLTVSKPGGYFQDGRVQKDRLGGPGQIFQDLLQAVCLGFQVPQ